MGKGVRKNGRRQQDQQQLEEPGGIIEFPLEAMLREGLHDLVVSAGMRVLSEILESERTKICGPRYEHQAARQAGRSGTSRGELVLGGRRVSVRRPRARTTDGREVELPSWRAFSREDPLQARAVEQMVIGVSTRKYDRSLERAPADVKTRGTSKSAVSRRFVAATKASLDESLTSSLADLDLSVIMIDGMHFAEHVILVALGIDAEGKKHVLGIGEGATENAAACTSLLTSLRERGVSTARSVLVVIDGSKALAKAVRDVFGSRALIQRCQVHKKRNVLEHLPLSMADSVRTTITQAYAAGDAARAEKQLRNLARRLEGDHPGAAGSLLEGLDETLTVMRFELPRSLERVLSTTNAIENLNGTARRVSRRVARWKGGTMILRWVGAAMHEASKGFRRVHGYDGMKKLVSVLQQNDRKLAGDIDNTISAA